MTLLFNEEPLELPERVLSYEEFDKSLFAVRRILVGIEEDGDLDAFLGQMYYLLGWFLGDLGKHFGPEYLLTASVDLSLTRRHPENLQLGDYVFDCIKRLGIRTKRGPDRESTVKVGYGAFIWSSQRSPVFGWFHRACLGLKWDQRPSYHRVNIDWILSAPRKDRMWFTRGLADSDGDIHFKDKTVDITTAPNTRFVKKLLSSLGCHVTVSYYRKASRVTITATDASEIMIFNPVVLTHRGKILTKLLGASTFERHWPSWLQDKVVRLLGSGLSTVEIRDQLLEEDNVFVKLHTLAYKSRQRAKKVADFASSAEGGIRAAMRLRTPDPQISS